MYLKSMQDNSVLGSWQRDRRGERPKSIHKQLMFLRMDLAFPGKGLQDLR